MTEFCLQFKENFKKFITKDNKIIDYVIIEGKKITNIMNVRIHLKIKSDQKRKNDNPNIKNIIKFGGNLS